MNTLLALWAQVAGGGSPPPPPPPATGILDTRLTNLKRAYGLILLVGTHTGPLATVRRSSDNATHDVYPATGSFRPDDTALGAWAGSDTIYVQTLYEQSQGAGGADDLVQMTTTKQPTYARPGVVDSVGSFMKFDGVDDNLVTSSNLPASGNYVIFRRGKLTDTGTHQVEFVSALDGGSDSVTHVNLWDWNASFGGGWRNAMVSGLNANVVVNQVGTGANTSQHTLAMRYVPSLSGDNRVAVFVDATGPVGASVSTAGTLSTSSLSEVFPITYGSAPDSTSCWSGYTQHFIIYDENMTDSDVRAAMGLM